MGELNSRLFLARCALTTNIGRLGNATTRTSPNQYAAPRTACTKNLMGVPIDVLGQALIAREGNEGKARGKRLQLVGFERKGAQAITPEHLVELIPSCGY